jgi:hypothetical protein
MWLMFGLTRKVNRAESAFGMMKGRRAEWR